MNESNMGLFGDTSFWGLILGGSSGIGLATAQKLASEGMNLCLVHRDRRQDLPHFERAVADMKTHGVSILTFNQNALRADMRSTILQQIPVGIQFRLLLHAISRGNLKRLTNTAPSFPSEKRDLAIIQEALKPPVEAEEHLLSEDDFTHTIQAMGTSLYSSTQALIAQERFAADARVLGLTSEGNQRAWPYYAAVSAAKATLESLVRSMAMELAPLGIKTNVIQAGITDTPSLRMIPGSDQLKTGALLRNPMGRLTLPSDVANVIALLATDEAACVNGALIPVDGGERLG